MAKPQGVRIYADTKEVETLGGILSQLQFSLNTDRHLNDVTKAAYAVLSTEFNRATHVYAAANVEKLHHVYEWEHVGIPGFQLWRLRLGGQGGHRTVTWNWKPSRTTVPTLTTVTGEPRFEGYDDKFDPSRLKRVHIFVWKAPMMEYNASVNIVAKTAKTLIFPYGAMNAQGMGTGKPTYQNQIFAKPGRYVHGNFTAWFVGWWEGQAQSILEAEFEPGRDEAFKRIFHEHLLAAPKTRRGQKTFTIGADAAAARNGRNIADAMAGDMTRKYYKMAERRVRRDIMGDDEDE